MTDPLTPTWDSHPPAERELLAYTTRVLDEHQAPLLRLAYALTGDWPAAQDVLEDAVLALSNALMAGQIASGVGPWLRSTVRHKAIDWVRARARERGALADLAQHPPDGPPDPAKAAERADTVRHVLAHLGDLPERERRAFTLRYLDGMTCDQAADAMGTSPQSVRNQCHRARERLRALLDDDPEISGTHPVGE